MIENPNEALDIPLLKQNQNLLLYTSSNSNLIKYDRSEEYKYLEEIDNQLTIDAKQRYLKTLKDIVESTINSSFHTQNEKEKIFKNLKVKNLKKDYLDLVSICSFAIFITITPNCLAFAENKTLNALICIILVTLPYIYGMYFLDNNFIFPKHREAIYNKIAT